MNEFELYARKQDSTPEDLLAICTKYVPIAQGKIRSGMSTDGVLDIAENLAGAILSKHGDLNKVSALLARYLTGDLRLPWAVNYVFSCACVREHKDLGVVLDQLWDLHEDDYRAKPLISGNSRTMQPTFPGVLKPTLWDEHGALKYRPEAFFLAHDRLLKKEVAEFFHAGWVGVRKVLDDYPSMTEDGRAVIDGIIRNLVYRSMMPDHDPVRLLLRSRLNDAEDAMERLNQVFEGHMCGNPDEDDSRDRLNHAFSLIDRLEGEQRRLVEDKLKAIMHEWLSESGIEAGVLEDIDHGIRVAAQVLANFQARGFDLIAACAEKCAWPEQQGESQVVSNILGMITPTEGREDCTLSNAMMLAILRALDDKRLVDMGLNDVQLAELLKLKGGSALIRVELLKSSRGQETVFGYDLGL